MRKSTSEVGERERKDGKETYNEKESVNDPIQPEPSVLSLL